MTSATPLRPVRPRLPAARRRRAARLVLAVALAGGAWGCDEQPSPTTRTFDAPIDFSYACEGAERTVAPENDERTENFQATRMCPDLEVATEAGGTRTVEGHLLGLVLNDQPAAVHLVQMNPASAGQPRILDTDPFVPGFTPLDVAEAPTRILRTDDWGAFYVLSRKPASATRIVVHGVQPDDEPELSTARVPLPARPADGLIRDGTLWIADARRPRLWRLDLAADPVDPPASSIVLPGEAPPRSVDALDGDGAGPAEVLVTREGRPIVERIAADGTVVARGGIRPACSDTLDNDGDGLTDDADPSCRDSSDPSEAGPETSRPEGGEAADFRTEGAAPLCDNGLDDDGDGFTDDADPSCADGEPNGEARPACDDGIDQDGDGLTDVEDPSCYGPHDRSEGQLRPFGPYHTTVVDAGGIGTWVYALDVQRAEIAVLAVQDDGFERVRIPEREASVPELPYRPHEDFGGPRPGVEGDDGMRELRAIEVASHPGPASRGVTDLELPAEGGPSLTSSRLRGELWSRLLTPEADRDEPAVPSDTEGTELWTPPGCDPDVAEQCVQPAEDDRSWYVFMPRLDGRIQLIEVVRRGVPVHRFAQSLQARDQRELGVGNLGLSLRGREIRVGNRPPVGFPSLGPLVDREPLVDPEEQPQGARIPARRLGVWPPDAGERDPVAVERVPTQRWTVTYEGPIPGAEDLLGRFTDAETFRDPAARFCEAGVRQGDLLTLRPAWRAVPEELRTRVEVTTDQGETCPAEEPERARIEVPITEVRRQELTVAPDEARIRPPEPTLDDRAIRRGAASLAACRDALQRTRRTLDPAEPDSGTEEGGPPAPIEATDALEPANLPARLDYAVRPDGAWTVVGSRSGFLHRRRWNPEAGRCETDESLDERFDGRLDPLDELDASSYETCPPTVEQLGVEALRSDETLYPEGYERFRNWSFQLDVFPGCLPGEEVGDPAEPVPPQRDTQWRFTVRGPDRPATIQALDTRLSPRVPMLGFRRQQLQLDTPGQRMHLLQIRPNGSTLLSTFE